MSSNSLSFTLNTSTRAEQKAAPSGGVQHERVIIIGSGPAGLTAALYTARANLHPLVIAGHELGGQVSLTYEIENYPGFPQALTGQELVEQMKAQAERFGARLKLYSAVTEVDFADGSPFRLKTDDGGEYLADAVIVTVGATARRLNVPGEKEFTGRGVSYCATCDGFFFRDQDIAVVGGGDSAMEEATFLTRFARSVTLVHRREEFRASKIMLDRARANEKIRIVTNAKPVEVLGDTSVTGLVLEDTVTGERSTLPVTGMFVAIGHDPRSELVRGQVDVDDAGYVKVQQPTTATNLPGVFAAGDLVDHIYRQAITAAGTGCSASLDAERWLAELPDHHPITVNAGY